MEFYEAVRSRRSVRSYRPDPISDEAVHRVLDTARRAPSGNNLQPTRLIVVKDEATKESLAAVSHSQSFIAEAPIVIVACGCELPQKPGSYRGNYGGYMGRYSVLVDVAIAVDHLTLAARAEGLGTCWIGAFDNEKVKDLLGVPSGVQVVALSPLGFPEDKAFAESENRQDVAQLASEGIWGFGDANPIATQ